MKQSNLSPSVLFLITLSLGLLLSWVQPWNFTFYLEYKAIRLIGIVLLCTCLILNFLSYRLFKSHFTTHDPFSTPVALIEKGVYALSRNPVYLALVLSQCGLSFIFDTVWIFITSIILFITLDHLIIPNEEKILKRKFKENYVRYKTRTRRWI